MNLIVFAHPDLANSHNAQVLRTVKETLEARGQPYEIIDLHRDNFSPLMTAGEARAMGRGSTDALVLRYQNMVRGAERLIFIYPVWWYGPPAILKGFFDRVFAADFAYNFQKLHPVLEMLRPLGALLSRFELLYPVFMPLMPVKQHLKGRRAVMIRTFGGDDVGYFLYGRLPQRGADLAVLEFCGVKVEKCIHWFNVRGSSVLPADVKKKIEAALAK